MLLNFIIFIFDPWRKPGLTNCGLCIHPAPPPPPNDIPFPNIFPFLILIYLFFRVKEVRPKTAAAPAPAIVTAPAVPSAPAIVTGPAVVTASTSVVVPVLGAQFVDEFGDPIQVVVDQGPPPLPGMGILHW
jgi:hypothetical protein